MLGQFCDVEDVRRDLTSMCEFQSVQWRSFSDLNIVDVNLYFHHVTTNIFCRHVITPLDAVSSVRCSARPLYDNQAGFALLIMRWKSTCSRETRPIICQPHLNFSNAMCGQPVR